MRFSNKDYKLIKNLESIHDEISFEEMECNESLLEIIADIINYLCDKEDFFTDGEQTERYENINDFIDCIESCISELKCDRDRDDDVLKYLIESLELIQKDA